MEKFISFIVPVYNVERYVKRCILSIVSQSIAKEKFELIVVNDGSTDNSLDILFTLKKEYPFIQIISTDNQGASAARNEGLKIASGKYLFFIDSDDWIEEGSVIHLLKTVEEADVDIDIILFGIKEVYDNGKIKILNSALSKNKVILSTEEYSNNYTIRSSAWNGLFKRHLFIESAYRFKEGFHCEDDDFAVKVFSQARSLVSLHLDVYNYYQRENSTTNNSQYKVNKKLIHDRIILLEENDIYIKDFTGEKYSGLKRKLDFCAVDTIRLIFQKNISKEDTKKYLAYLKKINYYPIPKGKYGYKYSIFRHIVNNRILFSIVANTPLKKYF